MLRTHARIGFALATVLTTVTFGATASARTVTGNSAVGFYWDPTCFTEAWSEILLRSSPPSTCAGKPIVIPLPVDNGNSWHNVIVVVDGVGGNLAVNPSMTCEAWSFTQDGPIGRHSTPVPSATTTNNGTNGVQNLTMSVFVANGANLEVKCTPGGLVGNPGIRSVIYDP